VILMRILVLINRRSGGFDEGLLKDYLELIRGLGPIDVVNPMGPRGLLDEASRGVQYDALVVVGGDGTVGLVATALRNTGVPIFVIPMGRGNTFYRVNYRDEDPALVIRKLLRGFVIRRIDVGVVHELNRCFVLGTSVGLMAEVARTAGRFRFMGGRRAYLMSALERTLLYPHRIHGTLSVNDSMTYDGYITYCSFGITPVRAGNAVIFPRASITDGLVDFLVVPRMGRLRLLRTRMGLDDPGSIRGQGRELRLELDNEVPVEVDGDFVGFLKRVSVSSLPSSLSILLPSQGVP